MTLRSAAPRALSRLDVFCIGVNAIVGSGIFVFPGLLALHAGPASALAFLACGLLLTTVALCYAELSGAFPRSGAAYVYASEAFGPTAGFGVGWVSWMTTVLSWAAVAAAAAASLAYFHPAFASPGRQRTLAAGLVLALGALNYRGIKLGAWTVNALTAAKLVPLGIFVLVGVFSVKAANLVPGFEAAPSGRGFGYAVFLALWPLQGFEVAPVPAGESERPQVDVPLAAVGSLLFATLLYVAVQAVAVGVHPGLKDAGVGGKPLAEAAALALGGWGGALLAGGGVLSMVGYNAGSALGSPRFLSSLAEGGDLNPYFAARHPVFGTPHRAIAATAGLTAAGVACLDFTRLVDLSNLTVLLQYLVTCAALINLRVTRPELPRPFRAPLGHWVAGLGCVVSVALASQVSFREGVFALCLALTGYLVQGLDRAGQRMKIW